MTADLLAAFLTRGVAAGTPLLLGTVGEIVAERAGTLNLGVEGMMAVGAVCGFAVAATTGDLRLALAAAAASGAALALLHALVAVGARGNAVVSGLAIATLGVGLSGLIGRPFVGRPLAERLPLLPFPVLCDLPVVGPALFRLDPLQWLAVALVPAVWFLLFRTRAGLVLRACGENPAAARAAGIRVGLVRTLCLAFGGACAGLAGAHLSLVTSPAWIEGMVAGRGWVVVALTIFSAWDPRRALLGALLFGGLEVTQFFAQGSGLPPQLLKSAPYVATLAALCLTRGGARRAAPAALNRPD